MIRPNYSLALAILLSLTGCYGSGAVLDRQGDGGEPGAIPACAAGTMTMPESRLTVEASGALTYGYDPLDPSPPAPTEVAATLDAIDPSTSTLHLTSTTGAIDVVVHPVDTVLLEALPLGRAVVARFDRGLTLTDASDGSLVFAVLSVVRTAELDAGPFRFEQGARSCVVTWFPGTTFTCAVGMVELDVDVRAEGYSATLGPDRAEDTATVAGRTFSITLVESRRMATNAEVLSQHPTVDGVCAPLYVEELAVVIGPG